MRGDGHSERAEMLLKGMYSSSSSEIFFCFLLLDVCIYVHVCMCRKSYSVFEENNNLSYALEEKG